MIELHDKREIKKVLVNIVNELDGLALVANIIQSTKGFEKDIRSLKREQISFATSKMQEFVEDSKKKVEELKSLLEISQ